MIYIAAWYYVIISIYQKLLAHIPIKVDHLDADASCPSGHFCGLTLLSKQQQKCYAARDSGAKCGVITFYRTVFPAKASQSENEPELSQASPKR